MTIRKLTALLLTVALLLVCTACGGKEQENSEPSSVTYFDGETTTQLSKETIDAAVAKGEMTIEFEAITAETVTQTNTHGDTKQAVVTLGMESSALTELLADSGYIAEDHRKVGESYIRYECGSSLTAYFYYTNDDRKNGLASIVYFGTAYGFEPKVSTVEDVKRVMGTPAAEGPAGEKALSMFLFYEAGSTYVDYVSGNNHISFFFHQSGQLSATVIYQEGLWIY